MILSEIEQVLEIVIASILFATGVIVYIHWKNDEAELKSLRDEAIKNEVADDKTKIHKEYDDKSLDSLLDSSPDIYRKLGPPKDN